MVRIVFQFCCLACTVTGFVSILFMKKLHTASLCSNGWLDVKSIAVNYLYGFNCKFLVVVYCCFYAWIDPNSLCYCSLFLLAEILNICVHYLFIFQLIALNCHFFIKNTLKHLYCLNSKLLLHVSVTD